MGRLNSCAAADRETSTSGLDHIVSSPGGRRDQKIFTSLAPSCEPPYQAAQRVPSGASQIELTCTLCTSGSGATSSALNWGGAAAKWEGAATTKALLADFALCCQLRSSGGR